MTTARHIARSFALALALALVHAEPAHACSGDPESGLAFSSAFPATGSSAPPNTRIWIPPTDVYTDVVETDVMIKADNVTVPATVSNVVIDGERKRTVLVLTPITQLAPGATVSVTVQGQLASTFTVGTTVDVTAPTTPAIERVDVEGAYFGGFSCPTPSAVSVTASSNDNLLLITAAAATELPTAALAMAIGTRARAVDLAEGTQSLHLLAVDVAGNASPSAPVPTFTVPAEQSGCSATRSSSWLCAALALLVLRRRRTRCSAAPC